MSKLKFCVRGLGRRYSYSEEADFILSENGWDDFNYRTVYTVTATHKLLNAEYSKMLGCICIMKKGQESGTNTLYNSLKDDGKCIEELPSDFVSIIRDNKLVKILFCILSKEERENFIKSLHVILDDSDLKNLEDDNCFKISLLRNISRKDLSDLIDYTKKILMSDIDGKSICDAYLERVVTK